MSNSKSETHIHDLIKKAAEAKMGADAMTFAQAACNAANALRAMADIKKNIS